MRLRSRIQKVEGRLRVNQPRFFVIYPDGRGPEGCLTEPPDDVRDGDFVIQIMFGADDEKDDADTMRLQWPEEMREQLNEVRPKNNGA